MKLMSIKYQLLKNEPYGAKRAFKYFTGYNDND